MFKEKIREILELVFEVEQKTNVFVSCNYDNKSKVLMVVAGEEIFVMSDNKYLYLNSGQCRDCLKKLIEEGEQHDE